MLLALILLTGQVDSGPISSPNSPTKGPTRYLDVHILVDENDYNINAFDAGYALEIASQRMIEATNWGYRLTHIDYAPYDPEVDPNSMMSSYLNRRLLLGQPLPHYVVVFAKDVTSVAYGAHTSGPFGASVDDQQWLRLFQPNFCNPAGSPFREPGVIYGAVVDWSNAEGTCGSILESLEWVRVSPTSLAGQCRNAAGLECIHAYGEWQCPNAWKDPQWLAEIIDPRLAVAASINHELLHFFGFKSGSADHFCSPDVPQVVSALSPFNMCGSNRAQLEQASARCVTGTHHPSDDCTSGAQCYGGFCSPLTSQCTTACRSVTDCPTVPGRAKSCVLRSCRYQGIDCIQYPSSTACQFSVGVQRAADVHSFP